MELSEAKSRLRAIENSLASAPWVEFHAFEREGRILHVAITERLRKSARKEGVWRLREMLATLKVIPESVSARRGVFGAERVPPPRAPLRRLRVAARAFSAEV